MAIQLQSWSIEQLVVMLSAMDAVHFHALMHSELYKAALSALAFWAALMIISPSLGKWHMWASLTEIGVVYGACREHICKEWKGHDSMQYGGMWNTASIPRAANNYL